MVRNLKKFLDTDLYYRIFSNSKKYGADYLKYVFKNHSSPFYATYGKWYDQTKPNMQELQDQRKKVFKYNPLISIVVPVFNPPNNFLVEMVDSVLQQTYFNWELCIANASVGNQDIKNKLNEYATMDERIKVVHLEKNYHISKNTNKALALAQGEYITLLDHDDVLPQHALFEIVSNVQEIKYDVLYSDEDLISEDLKIKDYPHFKPDWSPHLLECHNYITHLFIVKKSVIEQVGLFDTKCDGSQDHDFVLRCTDYAKSIHHIPKILYHWRVHQGSVSGNTSSKTYAVKAGIQSLRKHFKRKGVGAEIRSTERFGFFHPFYPIYGSPKISIIISHVKDTDKLFNCLKSLLDTNIYKNIEIIILVKKCTNFVNSKINKLINSTSIKLKFVEYDKSTTVACQKNMVLQQTSGDYILYIDCDITLKTADGIKQMLGCCMLPEVGIVGAKILYKDDFVKHAGMVTGFYGVADYVNRFIYKDEPGYINRANLSFDCSAISSSCLMIEKDWLIKIGKFYDKYVFYNESIDLCLKSRSRDKFTVCDCFVKWKSNQNKPKEINDLIFFQQKNFIKDKKLFQKRWGKEIEKGDPYYNKNFKFNSSPYVLRILYDILYEIKVNKLKKHKDGKFDVILKGWAITETAKYIDVRCFVNGKINKASISKFSSIDSFDKGISTKINNNDGFKISFTGKITDKIVLEFSTPFKTIKKRYSYAKLKKLKNKQYDQNCKDTIF